MIVSNISNRISTILHTLTITKALLYSGGVFPVVKYFGTKNMVDYFCSCKLPYRFSKTVAGPRLNKQKTIIKMKSQIEYNI